MLFKLAMVVEVIKYRIRVLPSPRLTVQPWVKGLKANGWLKQRL